MPGGEIEGLSVGYEGIRELVLDRIVALGEKGEVEPLLVRGEWGTGKSHFISYVRAVCRDLQVANSVVNLNARGHAVNHPQRSYPILAENLEFDGVQGLQGVLMERLRDEVGLGQLREFSRYPADGELERAIRLLCWEAGEGNLPVAEHHAWTTLLGDDIAWAVYPYKRKKALERFAALGRLFKSIGAPGLVLLFDEAETIDQLSNVRSRMGAYDVIGKLSRTKHICCIFAVTARFDRVLERDIGQGMRGNSAEARWFCDRWESRELDVVDPPIVNRDAAGTLAENVKKLYERAHGLRCDDPKSISGLVDEWLADPARNPRTLIRVLVDHLDRRREIVT